MPELFDPLHAFCYNTLKMEKIESKPLGAIDALSGGFELVLRHPWIIVVPIALDLFLWLGPQIRAQPVFAQMARVLGEAMAVQGGSPDTQQAVAALTQTLQETGGQFNVFSFLALFGMGVPTLVSLDVPAPIPSPIVLFSVGDEMMFVGWAAVLSLIGIFIGTVYLQWIAGTIRSEARGLRVFAARVLRSFAHILALVVALGIAGLVLLVPFTLGAVLISALSPGLGVFFILMIWLIVMWVTLYLAFAIPAIFVSGANVGQAILNSVTIFRYNFWSAMGLIFLIVLIQMGFSIIWQQFLASPLGFVVDMIANAILGSALVAAAMLFYDDRFSWLTQVRDRIRQQQRPSLKG